MRLHLATLIALCASCAQLIALDEFTADGETTVAGGGSGGIGGSGGDIVACNSCDAGCGACIAGMCVTEPAGLACAAGRCDGSGRCATGEVTHALSYTGPGTQVAVRVATGNDTVAVALACDGATDVDGVTIDCQTGRLDALLVAHDDVGALQWTQHLAGTSQVAITAVRVGENSVFVGGYTDGPITTSDSVLTHGGLFDGFVGSFDRVTGAQNWICQFGDAGYQLVRDLIVDDDDNAIIIGDFTASLGFGAPSMGSYDVFVAKIGPGCVPQWVRTFGDITAQFGEGITRTTDGRLHIVGEFVGAMTFGNVMIQNADAANYQLFTAELTADGAGVSGEAIGPGRGLAHTLQRIVTGDDDTLVLAGRAQASVDFGNGPLGAVDAVDFVLGSRARDGEVQFAVRYGAGHTMASTFAPSLAVDRFGSVVLGGQFFTDTTFGDLPTLSDANSLGDGFALKLSASGEHLWAVHVASDDGIALVRDVTTDLSGRVFVAGGYNGATAVGALKLSEVAATAPLDAFVLIAEP